MLKKIMFVILMPILLMQGTSCTSNPAKQNSIPETHCVMLQTDKIQIIIGDASRDGRGGTQYCGVWSLTSNDRVFNAFGNSYAGLIPGELRDKAPKLEVKGPLRADLVRSADKSRPVDVRASYELIASNTIEHRLTFIDHADMRLKGCDFREVVWCSYINSPEDSKMYFLSDGKWLGYISPRHGVASNIAPSYISDDKLEHYPVEDYRKTTGRVPFYWIRADIRFDEPFYYGRFKNMVLIYVFDHPQWLRFFSSPTGGGSSIISGKTSPAWDFMWIIPADQYEVGKEYTFSIRMIYKQFKGTDDVFEEARKAQKAMQKTQVK